jgi:ankyrin repeat protein
MNCTNIEGLTPLMYATTYEFEAIANYLSIRSNNPNLENSKGQTILSIYILRENLKFASKLISRGSNINYVNKMGLTVLHMAVEKKKPIKVIEWLIQEGANPHIEDKENKDCCDKVIGSKTYAKCKYLHKCKPELRIAHVDRKISKL